MIAPILRIWKNKDYPGEWVVSPHQTVKSGDLFWFFGSSVCYPFSWSHFSMIHICLFAFCHDFQRPKNQCMHIQKWNELQKQKKEEAKKKEEQVWELTTYQLFIQILCKLCDWEDELPLIYHKFLYETCSTKAFWFII